MVIVSNLNNDAFPHLRTSVAYVETAFSGDCYFLE